MVTKLQLTYELPEGFVPREIYPRRGPLALAEALRPFVRDKIFCDLGCGAGDIAELLVPYAKKVIGFEKSGDRNSKAQGRSFELVTGNLLESIPDADVYYNWSTGSHAIHLTKLLHGKKSLFVGGRKGASQFAMLDEMVEGMEIFEFDYHEKCPPEWEHYELDAPDKLFPTTWWIALI
jgi:SAM-dependent methyltransferase